MFKEPTGNGICGAWEYIPLSNYYLTADFKKSSMCFPQPRKWGLRWLKEMSLELIVGVIIKEIFQAHNNQKLSTFLHKTKTSTLFSHCILWQSNGMLVWST